jgi:hypothetical protein
MRQDQTAHCVIQGPVIRYKALDFGVVLQGSVGPITDRWLHFDLMDEWSREDG